ncbi:MAG TPA: DUF2213 domain-containing protein [Sphingomicrobium sp.]|jgi:hypothetical protein|nr:DUF2213 domain-containing protein [Sphingomicrobium sp.]
MSETLEDRHLHLLGAAGQVRTEKLNGRDYLVFPVVALMEGIIHAVNADEPEFVPAATLAEAADSWNGRPLVVGHPMKNGRPVSANDPRVMELQAFGQVFNSAMNGTRLGMEAWADPERLEQLGEHELLARIRAGKASEISVGAHVMTANGGGQHNGRQYKKSWRKAQGDHLAFLPRGRGACSLEMGCGSHRAAQLYALEEGGPRALGGPGSGHHGHEGRPGEIGGSAPSGGGGKTETIEKTFTSEKKAREHYEKMGQGQTTTQGKNVSNEMEYNKDGTYTVRTVRKTSEDDRDDLKSSFSSSLKEAHSMSEEDMYKSPALAARNIVEGALENPPDAGKLFDKATRAFNSMPERTARQISAKERAIRDFRFALTREKERAQYNAPKRWDKILKGLEPKALAAFECDVVEASDLIIAEAFEDLRVLLGARNSMKDAEIIQGVHDHAVKLGAQCDRNNYKMMASRLTGLSEQSLEQRQRAINEAVGKKWPGNGGASIVSSDYAYVREVFDSYVIVQLKEKLYSVSYTVAKDGSVTLVGEPVEVVQKYATAEGKAASEIRTATVRHEGGKWHLYTKDGTRKLGTHETKGEAEEQERAIEAAKKRRSLEQAGDKAAPTCGCQKH